MKTIVTENHLLVSEDYVPFWEGNQIRVGTNDSPSLSIVGIQHMPNKTERWAIFFEISAHQTSDAEEAINIINKHNPNQCNPVQWEEAKAIVIPWIRQQSIDSSKDS